VSVVVDLRIPQQKKAKKGEEEGGSVSGKLRALQIAFELRVRALLALPNSQ